jgi:hypothetical protein
MVEGLKAQKRFKLEEPEANIATLISESAMTGLGNLQNDLRVVLRPLVE